MLEKLLILAFSSPLTTCVKDAFEQNHAMLNLIFFNKLCSFDTCCEWCFPHSLRGITMEVMLSFEPYCKAHEVSSLEAHSASGQVCTISVISLSDMTLDTPSVCNTIKLSVSWSTLICCVSGVAMTPKGFRWKSPIERVIASLPLTLAPKLQSIHPLNDFILCSSSSLAGWWGFVKGTGSPILQIKAPLSPTLATARSVPSLRSATVAVVPQWRTLFLWSGKNKTKQKSGLCVWSVSKLSHGGGLEGWKKDSLSFPTPPKLVQVKLQ